MAEDEFFVEDETPEERAEAWRSGDPGVTTGPRDLNQRAMSIVARAVAHLDGDDHPPASVTVSVLHTNKEQAASFVDDSGRPERWLPSEGRATAIA